MNEDSKLRPKSSSVAPSIEEYVKSELQQSMISNTGVPKSFAPPPYQIPHSPQDPGWRSMSSLIANLSVKPTRPHRPQRSNSFVIKQTNMVLHKHQKMLEKITVLQDSAYYSQTPIKPGFMFLDSLIRVPRGDISNLEINIPETLYYTDKIFYLHTQKTGHVGCRNDVFGYTFMKTIESYRNHEEKCVYDKIAGIMRACSSQIADMDKLVMEWGQFKVKMMGNELSPYSLIQRFIHTPGHRPAVTRLYYFSHLKNNKANYAYFINNIQHELPDSLRSLQKCVVNTQDPKNIEVFTKSGSAIKYYEHEAKKIVKYLNRGYNLRIEEITLDFLTDSEGKIWMIGCKGFRIDETTLGASLMPLSEWWPGCEREKPSKKPENEYLRTFVHCKLCRLYYTNNQLSHLVSVRMLMLFKVHGMKRVKLPLDTTHLKVTSADMLSQSVRICQYCYMLVTTEFELISVEETLANSLNIPKKEINYDEDPKLEVQRHFLPKKILQWRLLVFTTKIYDSKFPVFTGNLHLQVKFGDIVTRFRLDSMKKTSENNEEVLVIDLLKVHYFFSNDSKTLKKLIKSKLLEFRITIGDKFGEKVLGASNCECLSGLPVSMSLGNALYTKKQILLFDSSDEVCCNLSVYLGLSCDKLIDTTSIKVSLTKFQEVYIPEMHFMSVDPLPVEWIELLSDDKVLDESFGKRIEEAEFYKPIMTKSEMLRMEDITSPFKMIPKIYSQHNVTTPERNNQKGTVTGLTLFKAVDSYLKVKRPRHSKGGSWSGASTHRSRKTEDTSRATPNQAYFKKKIQEIYKEFVE